MKPGQKIRYRTKISGRELTGTIINKIERGLCEPLYLIKWDDPDDGHGSLYGHEFDFINN